jgi:hypothetical protein
MSTIQLVPGDHLRVQRAGYWHHAILIDCGRVVHYTGLRNGKAVASIQTGPLNDFAMGCRFEVVHYRKSDSAVVVIRRALSRLGESSYKVLFNNCEHFATWCKTGVSTSDQVTRAGATAGGTAVQLAASTGAVAVVSGLGVVVGTSASGVMSGLAAVGAAIGGGAAAGIGVLATAPAVATSVAVSHVFRDNPFITESERAARKSARTFGRAASVVGAMSIVGIVSVAGVPGLSAVGISTGLVAVGMAIGGGMIAGFVVAIAIPALACTLLATLAYRASRGKHQP